MQLADRILAIVLCTVTMVSFPLRAKSQVGNAKAARETADNDRGDANGQRKWEHDPICFSVRDRNTIRNYYQGAPQVTKQNGSLSSPLKQPLHRNGRLPIGLQQLFEPLPPDIEKRLQPLNSSYSRGLIGKDAVIVETRTRRIMDIVRDVTSRQLAAKI